MEELTKLLKSQEEALLTAEVRTSLDRLSELLDDDFFEFGSSGTVIHKEDVFAENQKTVPHWKLSHFQVRMLAVDTALATYFIINKNSGRRTLRSSIWQNKQGKWKIVFHQGTVTKWDPEQLNSLLT
ncbi:DUF4440 domain-containing protein [Shouchella clausii]|uniref:DUF4440 domain-containing protein n=1 Tax=Shouchella clausii TaxID=79880 RepID=A0A268NV71_SHOCL|nr:DUF4440 domain-containing protein [Shouchella clausii]PAD14239.1 hypothetical protein CHH73_18340 [Shouchella clausii]PAE87402.1 hypothetical protein CHH72_18260 [Shouchella clausii]PAE91481.1 hypothetical protein CHH70_18270 [Shouchella clausii]GIN18074.1 hypothetical protein J32TS2_34300 [Shouchella clausii]